MDVFPQGIADRDEQLEHGFLHLEYQNLSDKDFERILRKLRSPIRARERRPRKCRKVDGINLILSWLPTPVPVHYLKFLGNYAIGDAGMLHLHLVPDSVTDFDLSDCSITHAGAKTLCEFLAQNTSITRFTMWGNDIGDQGAKYLAEMLQVNTTIEELSLRGCDIGAEGFRCLSNALAVNTKLRSLSLGCIFDESDDSFIPIICPGLAVNRTVEVLDITLSHFSEEGVECLNSVLQSIFTLQRVTMDSPFFDWDYVISIAGHGSPLYTLEYFLTLNRYNRKIILDDNATLIDWMDSVIRGAVDEKLDATYFLLRNKPELCMYGEVRT